MTREQQALKDLYTIATGLSPVCTTYRKALNAINLWVHQYSDVVEGLEAPEVVREIEELPNEPIAE